MAIDPSVYSRIQGPATLATLGEIAQSKAQQASARKAELENASKERDLIEQAASDAALKTALQTYRGPDGLPDFDAAIRDLYPKFPKVAQQLQTQVTDQRRKAADGRKAELDAEALSATLGSQALQNVLNEPPDRQASAFAAALPIIQKLDPTIAEYLGSTFDPTKIQQVITAGTSLAQYNTQHKEAIDRALSGKPEEYIARLAPLVPDAEHWDDLKTGARLLGASPQTIAQMGDYSPENAKRIGEVFGTTKADAGFTLSPGQKRFDAHGTPIASVAPTAAAGWGSISAADQKLVRSVLQQPQIYNGLTPTVKSRIASALADAGFDFSPASSGKPPTGAQQRTFGFFNRAKQASEELEKLEDTVSKMGAVAQTRMAVGANTPWIGNFLQSQTGQAYTAAQRAFTEARLRKDSGAAIPEQEFTNDRRTYFTQPGDSAATIAQKKRARAAILASLAFESGPAVAQFYGDEAEGLLDTYKRDMNGGGASKASAAVIAVLASKGAGDYTLSDGHTYRKDAAGAVTVVP